VADRDQGTYIGARGYDEEYNFLLIGSISPDRMPPNVHIHILAKNCKKVKV